MYVKNEINVGEDLILVIVEQQHQILGTQENIHKDGSTKILDFKRQSMKNMIYIKNSVQNIKKHAKCILQKGKVLMKKG